MRQHGPAKTPATSRLHHIRAFTLVEVAVVSLIIGLLAVLAIPSLKRSIIAAKSDAVMNDLRIYATAYSHYMQEKGDWPEDSAPGEYPPGMEQYLRATSWTKKSPIGGYYNWESNTTQGGVKIRAAIAISSLGTDLVTSDKVQLDDIDRRSDDGNLSSGLFRLGFGMEPIFIIEN